MTDRRLEYVPLDDLPEALRNPHVHASEVIAASITRFGFVDPPEVDERTGRLVAGHGRKADLLARHARGDEVPDGIRVDGEGRWLVPVVRGWASKDDADAEAYLIASNRPTELATWEPAELAEMLQGLAATDDGLLGVGYDPVDIESLLASIDTVHVAEHERSNSEPIEARYVVLVECETEHQQRDLLGRFMEEGLNVKALLT